VEIIQGIPPSLEPGEIARCLRLRPDRPGSVQPDELIGLARPLISLRAIYDISYVGRKDDDGVEVAGVFFQSRVLRHNLAHAQKVFPFIITIGAELEQAAASLGDLLRQYYLEEIANFVLEQGAAWLTEKLQDRWGFSRLSSMSPGSLEDWPITEQAKLFSLFGDTEKSIGVRLTERMLMLPRKSISGILFPSEEEFTACRLCPREKCPSRRAAYDESLAAEFTKRPLKNGPGEGRPESP
jgi:Vitamin B12 dependent methionine synthase, activation domain